MAMYTVRRGDCLSSIALAHGFADASDVYDDPNNAEFRRLRPNPDVIYPGDQLFIPEQDPAQFDCGTGQKHRFVVHRPKCMFRLTLEDRLGEPWGDVAWIVTVDDEVFEGTTGADGLIEVEIAADAQEGTLEVRGVQDEEDGEIEATFPLSFGGIDPIETPEGQRGRLKNLGYDCSARDGRDGLERALATYRRDRGIESEDANATLDALAEHYGC